MSVFLFTLLVQAVAATNTNHCLPLLGTVQSCFALDPTGYPLDVPTCCDALFTFKTSGCDCNPTIDMLLGPAVALLDSIPNVCLAYTEQTFFNQYRWLLFQHIDHCEYFKTHYYGCVDHDMDIDAARLANNGAFGYAFQDGLGFDQCLNMPLFKGILSQSLRATDPYVKVPYGVGTYTGINGMSEYLSMVFAGFNHHFWTQHSSTPLQQMQSTLYVSDDGLVWSTTSRSNGHFFNGCDEYYNNYAATQLLYSDCETKLTGIEVQGTDGMAELVEKYVYAARDFDRYGIQDICKYHELHCTGTYKQYDNFTDCVDYVSNLPVFTETCGDQFPMGGHSLLCFFKHKLMIRANPVHCEHIGKIGVSTKCNDAYECDGTHVDPSWATLTIQTPSPTPISDCADASNINFQNESLGCIIL